MVHDEVVMRTVVLVENARAGDVLDIVLEPGTGKVFARLHGRADATLIDLDSLTWTCMVCGAERPDALIDVAHRPLAGHEDQFPHMIRVNVRHCADRAGCVAVATAPGPWRGGAARS